MKSAIYIINKGFHPSTIDYKFHAIPLQIVQLGFSIGALDNESYYYTMKDKKLIREKFEVEKEYRSNFATIKNMDKIIALTKFEQTNILNCIGIWLHEKEFFQFQEFENHYISLFFYPIDLFYTDFSVTAFPIIKIYGEGSIIIEYTFNFKNISTDRLQLITSKIETEQITSIGLSANLLKKMDIKLNLKKYIKNVEEDSIEYRLLQENKSFKYLNNLTDFFLKMMLISNKPTIFYGRNSYLINCTKLSSKNITAFLNGGKSPMKNHEIGKDYRIFKDYYHYLNNSYTLIYGKHAIEHFASLRTIEQHMILQTLNDSVLFNNLATNKYTYEELKKIRLNMMESRNHHNLASYSEIDTILRDLHTSMSRNDRIENIDNILNQKLKEKEMEYQDRISIILMLLGCAPLAEYIILPLLKIYYNNVNFNYNHDFISIISFIVSALTILIGYLVLRKNMNKL